jgi:hypothetical protein
MARRGRQPIRPPQPSATPAPASDVASTPPRFAPCPRRRAAFALACAVASGLFLGIHPGSFTFWDPGRSGYWRTLYVPGERPKQFAKIADLIPTSARVASTDFVHPRYTHFERSYDYSDYARKVAGYDDKVPDDTDYIVIDTQHPYSKVRELGDVRELKTEPAKWEVVPNDTKGYFIVLKRRQ